MHQPTPIVYAAFAPLALRRMRLAAGLSLEAVALNAGLYDKGQVSRFERGAVVPLATTLGLVLHVLQPDPILLAELFRFPLIDPSRKNRSAD